MYFVWEEKRSIYRNILENTELRILYIYTFILENFKRLNSLLLRRVHYVVTVLKLAINIFG